MSYQPHHHDTSQEIYSKTIVGFWLYLMTDCILFATFFAAYAVLVNGTFGGPSGREIFNYPFVLIESLIFLASSFACGPAQMAAERNQKGRLISWIVISFLLGLVFLTMVMTDFTHLVQEGNSWGRNAFLSAYFTLVGTLLLHIVFGLLWMVILLVQIAWRGLSPHVLRRTTCLAMFWHFLNIVWVFIFAIVYMMGAI